ncbi:MAG: prepilin-type N-terminal cleavage/methylation domain-containing protein [Oscillospiraceae bacterium]|nr:prepilin-type N-terminal cleavage/methylation domain-containing protein [Oscillospiraceae bacterium]
MNKRNMKRGFTITELVIVIVVIAILAAVLIPTFASLIKKANQSADIQAARQMDIALQAESATEKPTTLKEVVEILSEAGFDAEGSLKPITKDHKFYWYKSFNMIVLANEEDVAAPVVVYPTKNEELANAFVTDLAKTGDEQVLFDLELGFYQYVEIEVEKPENALNALSKGQSITLTEDITVAKAPEIPAGANTTLDLGGKTFSTTQNESTGRSDYLNVRGTLTLENGTFNGRGIQVWEGGKLIIGKNANISVNCVDANGGAAIWVYSGGEVVIDGGTFKATGGDKAADEAGIVLEPGVINNSGKVTINGGTFAADKSGCYAINNAGEMIVNGGDFSAYRGVFACTKGTITVNNGKFAVTHNVGGWAAFTSGSGKIIINGGQFTSQGGMFTGSGIQDNLNK